MNVLFQINYFLNRFHPEKKKRGRPAKTETRSAGQKLQIGDRKGKRGRPRKVKVSPESSSDDSIDDNDSSDRDYDDPRNVKQIIPNPFYSNL